MTIKTSIIGASGYTGGELLRILKNHPKVEVLGTYGKTTAGESITDLHPNLKDVYNFTVQEPNYHDIGKESDLVFTATPHGVAMDFVPTILESGARVVDLSADYRLDNIQTFEKYYQEHTSPNQESVYGLPEINRSKIKNADLVANPGCYPTAAILSIVPLIEENLIYLDKIIIDSKSGTSGAGAKPSEKLHHPNCSENISAYSATNHRHNPEIEQEIEKIAGSGADTFFTPHLVPIVRGILNTSHVFLLSSISESELLDVYQDYYRDEPFVRILIDLPKTKSVKGSNYCDIGLRISREDNRAVVISALDNLVKGASGQAVQNMNIMFGLDEKIGLENVPIHP